MDLAVGYAPGFEVLPEVLQSVAMFGEDEQFAAAVLEFLEFSLFQALLRSAIVSNPLAAFVDYRWPRRFPQGGDFGLELVEAQG